MTTTRLRVLLVDDSENDATLTLHELRRGGYDVESVLVEDAEAARHPNADGDGAGPAG